VALALIVSELIARQRPLIKASFNVAVVILYTAAACAVFSLLGSVGQSPLANWQQVIAWLLAAITHVLVNASLLALMISMATRVPLLPLWREMVSGGEMQHWLQPLLGGLIAIMQLHSPWALILVILPLLAIYVSNRRLYQVGQETRTVIETLVDTLDRRDPATFEHSVRVTDYTRRILEQLYPTAGPEVTRILAASRIHDLGKVAVSDATLYKNGPLDGPEWRQMRHHPVIGAQLLRPLSIYQEGLAIVRHHHERWDGTGYPDGLAGEQIPFGARVLAVADSFDAMTTDRPYRRALSIETALKEIEAGSGSQFDPTVVEAFLTVMRSRPAATSLRPLPGTPSGA
jgi:HD-GYP domain-containing protein (c-di-GMP phosphodiesterase class II)